MCSLELRIEVVNLDSIKTYLRYSVCVCVNSATDALGLSHDGLSRHRAGLPAHLGAAVNKD
jgi:hypothetical protein